MGAGTNGNCGQSDKFQCSGLGAARSPGATTTGATTTHERTREDRLEKRGKTKAKQTRKVKSKLLTTKKNEKGAAEGLGEIPCLVVLKNGFGDTKHLAL